MPHDASSTVADFLAACAAKMPAPGGGAAAALCGALAASMGEMTLNYSVGRKGGEANDPALSAALIELTRARELLLTLLVEDQLGFEALTAAKKSAGGKGDGDPAVAAALLACIRIPQSIAACGHAIVAIAGRIAPIANRWLLSDLAVCVELATATVRAAGHNIRVNLGDVSDLGERERFRSQMDNELRRAVALVEPLIVAIWKRLES